MPDNINEILSPEAEKQLQELQEGLDNATKQIVKFGQAAKGITIDFKGVKDFYTLAELQNKVKDTTEKMTTSAKVYNDTIQQQAKVQEADNKRKDAAFRKEYSNILRLNRERENQAKREQAAAKRAQLEKEREAKATAKLNNAYEQLKIKYRDAANEAKRLGAEFGVTDARAKAAANSAMQMYNSLLAVEKSVGQAQRQVGQYNTAAFAMQQILRETPAFAYSAATGFLAISNNIPILLDEIQKLKVANAALRAEGAATIPIWKTLAKSIFSINGLLTIGIGILTIVMAKWDSISSAIGGATNKYKEFADEQKKSIYSEKATIETALSVARDFNQEMDTRLAAVKKLKSEYPEYLGQLTDESILSGTTADAVERLNKALANKALMMAAKDMISEQAKEYIELTNQLEKYQERLAIAEGEFKHYNNGRTDEVNAFARLSALQDKKNAERDIKATQRKIKLVEREMQKYQDLANKFAGSAAGLLFPSRDDKTKQTSTKSREAILKGEEELLKAQFDLAKQRVEQDRDNQKDITDNVEEELQKRLEAHMKYQTDLIQLADMQAQLEIDIEEVKINKLKEQRKKATSAAERKDIDKQIMAAFARQRAAEEDYNQKVNKITLDGRKEVLNIVKTSNEEWLKIQSDSFEARKQAEIDQYLTEEKLLQHALETGQLTRRQHAKKVEELHRKQRISALQAEVEFDKRLLKNQELTNEQRLALQKKLNSDEQALFNAQQGKKPRGKSTFRITDGIARLLGGAAFLKADLETQEKFLQSFYDSTVNLARAAADAIIQINENRFKGEMDNINRLQDANKFRYEEQVRQIEFTAENEIDRKNKLAIADARFRAQEAEYEQEKRKIAQQQARFQRTASIAAAVSNTAVAITKVIAELGILAAPIVPIIAATGAAQVATISSAPIPKYAKGKNSHPGGLFWAGDGGEPEYVKAPNKPGYWTPPTSTLYNEKAGTSVTPLSKMVRNVNITGNYTPGTINEVAPHDIMYEHLANLIGEKFDETGQNLASFIARYGYKPQKQQNMGDAIRRIQNSQGF